MITPQKFAFSLCFPSWLYYFNTCSEFATSFFHLTTIGMESVELPSEWGIKKDQVKWIVNRGTCVGWPSYGSTDTVSCRGIFLALSLLCAVLCYSTTVSCTIYYCPVVCRSPVHSYLFEFFFVRSFITIRPTTTTCCFKVVADARIHVVWYAMYDCHIVT